MDIAPTLERPHHRRNKSAAVLQSIMPKSKTHKRTPSEDTRQGRGQLKDEINSHSSLISDTTVILPPNHPHAGRILGERQHNNNTPPPRRAIDTANERQSPMHKKTLSTVSLRSAGRDKEDKAKDKTKEKAKAKSQVTRPKDNPALGTPRKSKSTTNLTAVFSKSKAAKQDGDVAVVPKDKENTTPPSSSTAGANTPIWAEFVSSKSHETNTTTKVPLNDKRALAKELEMYMPKEYSPSKQRNFYGYDQPTLARQRPKSEVLHDNGSVPSMFETLSSKVSSDRPSSRGQHLAETRRSSSEEKVAANTKPTEQRSKKPGLFATKRGSRVMAAVAALNNKTSLEAEVKPKVDPKQIDAEFEAVLKSRDIPENLRLQMRTLKTNVKADFIRSHQVEQSKPRTDTTSAGGSISSLHDQDPESDLLTNGDELKELEGNVRLESSTPTSTKRSRPRSKTFTFKRRDKDGASPTKKQRSEQDADLKRSSRHVDLPKSPSTASLGKPNSSSFFGKSSKSAVPEEYVSYLRRVQDPKEVEVGKLHKLRLLLRNETVSWVVNFITLGGMTGIVELLHRIMQVEWREDHEDQLLHETLLCLKGLCTTDLALQKLCEIENTLFPALLGMIFDPEHKGPSDFTTRGIIMAILLAHLTAAANTADLPIRAQTILSYLADPTPPDEKAPIPFILSMRQSRPYKVWCTEINNVTKEVFWIFMHHLNVVAFPKCADAATEIKSVPQPRALNAEDFSKEFFPGQRPPVPAAPYVGGVEWDATNYLASHLDILNGLLASIPTRSARNALRTELRASGFEKVMGAMLRTCKEKFYGYVHDGLRTWVAAACADGWDVRDVRMGPRVEESSRRSPKKTSPVKASDNPPVLEAPPKLDLGLGKGAMDDWV